MPLVRITKVLEALIANVTNAIKKSRTIIKASTSKHKVLLPIIAYLEAVTKESDPSSLQDYPVLYQIASDIAKLAALNDKLSCFYLGIEEQLKDGQVLNIIKKE